MLSFGWSIEYVNGLEIPDVLEQLKQFETQPPVHILARAHLGWNLKAQPNKVESALIANAEDDPRRRSFDCLPVQLQSLLQQGTSSQ